MAFVYHLVTPAAWEQAPAADFRAPTLDTEAFIHCCYAEQVAGSANRFYAAASELLVLAIDPQRLSHPLRAEPARSGQLFPHIYGPINRSAVVAVRSLQRGADGRWAFSE